MQQTPATRRACWIGAQLPVCFAIWLHGPMWDGGLLSDDLVLRAYVVDPGPHGPVVAWRRVLEDLQGPWLFGSPLFYRPLVTFTFVLDFVPDRGPASTWSIGGFEVAASADCSGGRVVWQAKDGRAGEIRLGPSRARAAPNIARRSASAPMRRSSCSRRSEAASCA